MRRLHWLTQSDLLGYPRSALARPVHTTAPDPDAASMRNAMLEGGSARHSAVTHGRAHLRRVCWDVGTGTEVLGLGAWPPLGSPAAAIPPPDPRVTVTLGSPPLWKKLLASAEGRAPAEGGGGCCRDAEGSSAERNGRARGGINVI